MIQHCTVFSIKNQTLNIFMELYKSYDNGLDSWWINDMLQSILMMTYLIDTYAQLDHGSLNLYIYYFQLKIKFTIMNIILSNIKNKYTKVYQDYRK